jgi:hypothetical protein
MNKKERRRIMREFEKKDVYTTHTFSVEKFDGFLSQCRRAVNKLYGYRVSTKYDFWSTYAKKQAYKHCYGSSVIFPGEKERAEYEKAKNMSYWQFLKKYSYLSVYDGFLCIDFEFGGMVFATYSSQAMTEMGITTKEETDLYVECVLALN